MCETFHRGVFFGGWGVHYKNILKLEIVPNLFITFKTFLYKPTDEYLAAYVVGRRLNG